MATQRICSVDGCGKPIKASGLCNTHYAKRWRAKQPLCSEPGCSNAKVSRGLCDAHYRKVLNAKGRKIGRPGETLPCAVKDCKRPHSAFGYCEPHYARFKRHGDPNAGIADRGAGLAFIEDVLSRKPTNACIEWFRPFRGKSRKSYASVSVDGKSWPAHRYVCFRAHGPEPHPNMETCHSCANKRCINPQHLRWGTEADNGADRSLHGTVCRGVDQKNAKLTDDDIRFIRAAPSSVSNNELGRRFGVTGSNIGFIRKNQTWKHVA
jgi:hypothetical protein